MVGEKETPDDEAEARADPDAAGEGGQGDLAGELATLRDWLNLDVENVIGIFGKENDMHALLRRPDGEMLKVRAGDAALGGRVQAIDEEAVVIVKNARAIVLKIGEAPKGPRKSDVR